MRKFIFLMLLYWILWIILIKAFQLKGSMFVIIQKGHACIRIWSGLRQAIIYVNQNKFDEISGIKGVLWDYTAKLDRKLQEALKEDLSTWHFPCEQAK